MSHDAEHSEAMGLDAIRTYFGKLSKNECPICGAAIERQQQVGHCVYAKPCGHRLYQGTVGAFAPASRRKVGGGGDGAP